MNKALKTIAAMALIATHISVARVFATGTSSAQFLKLGAGARAAGMGDAFTSIADDVTAGYWNPAGLAQIKTAEIAAMQDNTFVNTQYQYLAGALPMGRNTLAASVYRLDYGSIDRYSNNDVRDGSFNAGSLAGGLSIGRQLSDQLMAGATLKYISESIDGESATSFAADFGAIYRLDRVNVSAVVQNVGPSMKMVSDSSPLPTTVRLGASTKFLSERLLTSFDLSKPNDAKTSMHAGAEYRVIPMLVLRAGYMVTPGQSTNLGGLTGVNAGLGAMFNRFNLDYAVAPFGDLGITHRFSVGYRFGESK